MYNVRTFLVQHTKNIKENRFWHGNKLSAKCPFKFLKNNRFQIWKVPRPLNIASHHYMWRLALVILYHDLKYEIPASSHKTLVLGVWMCRGRGSSGAPGPSSSYSGSPVIGPVLQPSALSKYGPGYISHTITPTWCSHPSALCSHRGTKKLSFWGNRGRKKTSPSDAS